LNLIPPRKSFKSHISFLTKNTKNVHIKKCSYKKCSYIKNVHTKNDWNPFPDENDSAKRVGSKSKNFKIL